MLFKDKVTIPLEMPQLQEVMKQRTAQQLTEAKFLGDCMGIVNYKDSNLKGVNFVNYVSNLKLSLAVDFTDVSKEDRIELVEAYMLSPGKISDIKNLSSLMGVLLFEMKGVGVDVKETEFLALNKEERGEFRTKHEDTLIKWRNFFDNLPTTIPFYSKLYTAGLGKQAIKDGHVKINKDVNYVSKNIACLVAQAGYIENFLSLPQTKDLEATLFEAHLFDPIFDGHSLSSVLAQTDNPTFVYFIGLCEGWVKDEQEKISSQTSPASEESEDGQEADGPDSKAD